MWESLKDQFDIDEEPCNFYMEYTTDKQFRIEETNKFQERKNTLKELFKKAFWLENVEIDDEDEPYQCVGGCNRRSTSIKLTYHNEKRNLCFDCFINKNEELSKKYNFIGGGKCLLKIK